MAKLAPVRARGPGHTAPTLPAALAPREANRVHLALSWSCFRRYEAPLLQWMQQSPANARLFARDPFAALASSDLAVPADIVTELRALSILMFNITHD